MKIDNTPKPDPDEVEPDPEPEPLGWDRYKYTPPGWENLGEKPPRKSRDVEEGEYKDIDELIFEG